MEGYGIAVYPRGVELHLDGRHRRKSRFGWQDLATPFVGLGRARGAIQGFTAQSRKRLAWVLANAPVDFALHVTLTYHARVDESDSDQVASRNLALVKRAKEDLNRFLGVIRAEGGRYVWIQEFQKRGAIHYHLLIERAMDERRLAIAWCKATDQLHDPSAIAHSVKAQPVEDQVAARKYLIKYFGKAKQKGLPAGVSHAGRYWGASRSLQVEPLAAVISAVEKATRHDPGSLMVRRVMARYIARTLGFDYRSGRLHFWDESFPQRCLAVMERLRAYYRDEALLLEMSAKFDWELADEAKELKRLKLEGGDWDKLEWL